MNERKNISIVESLPPGFASIKEKKIFIAFIFEILLSFVIALLFLMYTSILSSIVGIILFVAAILIAILIVQPFIAYTIISAYYKKIRRKRPKPFIEIYSKIILVMILQAIIVAVPTLVIYGGTVVLFTLYSNSVLDVLIIALALGIALGIFLDVKLIFSLQELIIKNNKVWDSIRHSFRDTRKKFWKLLAFAFVFMVLAVIINAFINYVINYNNSSYSLTSITAYISVFLEMIIDSYIGVSLLAGITDYFIRIFS